ncbi:hypothetical protein WICMUC_005936 [Wickerhamomyces mucosus]|uniref:2-dehydropantoate 2-reductase n=1 Tax=Wickerhamomyces mucosus TaxID=1378264 RepID=A0A9P8P1H7_9ASCO|nr:hypothetical protein WICMUC_005936 [Wickerhamomyces mucosus]
MTFLKPSMNSIHILGVGAMGGIVAHELMALANRSAITLLFRNEDKARKFQNNNNSTLVLKKTYLDPIAMESNKYSSASPESLTGTLETLIVTTKTYQTKSALEPYLPLITPDTNIVLLQNGLGVSEELYKEVWPDVNTRPNLFQGVINHSGYINSDDGDNYEIIQAGKGDIFIARAPRDFKTATIKEQQDVGDLPDFLQQLVEADLNTTVLSFSDLLVYQIRKFAVNYTCNSTTSILDCMNGELDLQETAKYFRDLLNEVLAVFFKTKPVLLTNPKTDELLNIDYLVDFCLYVSTVLHAKNSSSMRQDTLNLRDTEVDYLSGYVVREAEERGLQAPYSRMLTNLVKMRLELNRNRAK